MDTGLPLATYLLLAVAVIALLLVRGGGC